MTTTKVPPAACCICDMPIKGEFYDAKLRALEGSWGDVCPICFAMDGAKLGVGRGQHYRQTTPTGQYYKVAG